MTTDDEPTVLIVEDELVIATTLEFILVDKGFRVLGPSATVNGALELLQRERPDVALIDFRLAHSTTEALLVTLEQNKIPVCVLTGYNRDQLPPSYRRHVVLEKPFRRDELLHHLQQLIA